MLDKYEINRETIIIIPQKDQQSLIYEIEKEFLIEKKPIEIIDQSCKFFGSSYIGRFEGTKQLVGYNYKSPIIIEESSEIIFFPTTSPRLKSCIWISLQNIKKYIKIDDKTLIIFKNNKEFLLDISINSLENQILRASRLESILIKNKKRIKNEA